MKKWIICTAALLVGCGPDPDTRMNVASPTQTSGRVEITRIGVIADSLAYDSRRGIYVIKDNQTGQEFIGVSGVGITEVARHSCGKSCTKEDER